MDMFLLLIPEEKERRRKRKKGEGRDREKELKKIKSYIPTVIRTKLNDRLRGIKPRKQCIRTDVPGISLFRGMNECIFATGG